MSFIESIKVKMTPFESLRNTVNQFSASARASASKIGSIFSNWTAYVPSWKAGSAAPAAKQSSASSLSKLQPSYLPKAAALLALPVLGIVVWCLKSGVNPVQPPGGQGQLQPDDLLKNQLTHSKAENGTVDFKACGPLSNGLMPCAPLGQEQLQFEDLFKAQLTSISVDESRTFRFIENGSCLHDTAVIHGMEKPITAETSVLSADLPSWEKERFSLASHQEAYANRTDCPVENQMVCLEAPARREQPVTVKELQEHIAHVGEKKNYREALEAVIAATDQALEISENGGNCTQQDFCFNLSYYSHRLVNVLMKYDQFHPQILEIAKKWGSFDFYKMTIFQSNSRYILQQFVKNGKYYHEAFEIAKSLYFIYTMDIFNELIAKDALLPEIFDFTTENMGDSPNSRELVLVSLIGKGLGREFAIDLIAENRHYYDYRNVLKALTETPERLMATAQLFVENPSLQKHAEEFFRRVCRFKEGCPQAYAVIRKILPSITNPRLVAQLEKLLYLSWSTWFKRLIGFSKA